MNKKVNVIGSGVIGLTTALLLQEKGYDVTIIAAEFPGDNHIEYTSPCAGARWKTLALNSDLRLQSKFYFYKFLLCKIMTHNFS